LLFLTVEKLVINTNIRKIKLIIKGAVNCLLFKLIYRRGFDSSKTLVIFGSIRSGSTWLAEIISSLDDHLQIFEPLHPDYVPCAKKHMPEQNKYVPVDEAWPAGVSVFNKILSGRVINAWIMSQASLLKVLTAKRLVVKIVRGNLLLEWFANNVAVLPPALVIRHPCAVIASHINKGWPPGKNILLNNPYLDRHPEIRKNCKHLSQPEELAALAWCLRYHAPLMAKKPYPFVLVCYENLVRNGEQELKKLFDAWQMPLDQKAVSQLTIPSDTVTSSSQVVSGRDPLAGWENKLTEQQVKNILAVLAIFKMDFYSMALEPDYEKLMVFGSLQEDD